MSSLSVEVPARTGQPAAALDMPKALIAVLAIVAWTVIVSIPTFRFDDADDAFFVEVAHLWTRGAPPFVASFDIKGIGFFAALALAEQAFGASLATLKIVAVAASCCAGALLYALVARFDRPAAVISAALYPILMIISGDAAYQLLNVFLLAALAAALSDAPASSRAWRAGLAVGCACAIKQTCAIDAAALLGILSFHGSDRLRGWRPAALFAACAALAPLAFFAYYLAIGDAGVFWRDLVVAALSRGATIPWSTAPGWFLEWILPLSGLALVAPFAAARPSGPITRGLRGPLGLWLGLETLGIFAQHGGYRTAMVPLIAPLLMLSATFVSETYAAKGRGRQTRALTLFGAVIFAQAMLGHGDAILKKMTIVDGDALAQIQAAVSASHPSADDRLLVLNGPVWPNIATNLSPPTPYFHWGHIMCDFPAAGFPALLNNFAAAPKYVVFENANRRLACETEATASAIARELNANYAVIAEGKSGPAVWKAYERAR